MAAASALRPVSSQVTLTEQASSSSSSSPTTTSTPSTTAPTGPSVIADTSGNWSGYAWTEESTISGGIALNGTECLGCQVGGVYYNRFPVTGSIDKAAFTIEIHDASHLVLHGGLGPNLPPGPQIGCEVANNAGALRLRWDGHVMLLWPEGDYASLHNVGSYC